MYVLSVTQTRSNKFSIMQDIDKLCKKYTRQTLLLTASLFIIALIIFRVWNLYSLLIPLVISVLFTIVVDTSDALLWRRIAKSSPESLTTFYSAVSGIRMLLALATMFVYYLVEGRGAMLHFFIVFAIFYFVMVAHHSIFFAKVSNRT